MGKKRLEGLLVTDRMDQLYLTGFTGEDGAALVTPRGVTLLTDGRFTEAAAVEAPWARAAVRKSGTLPEAIARAIGRLRLGRVGFDPSRVSVATHRAIGKALRTGGRSSRLTAVTGIVEKLRVCKDADEVAATRRAIAVAEAAFKATLRTVRVGQTEREVAARLEYEMKKRGASAAAFDLIVAEGPNAALPHAHAGDRKIKSGSAVLCDWGAVVDHYRSDLTRVFFVDRVPPKIRRIYAVVLEAQLRGIAGVRAGVRMCDADAAARRHIANCGFGKEFGHSLGHGLGLDIHEPPRLARRLTDRLEAGMIVTVEPGVYLPGVGGVRIEDDVLVTADGCEVLSSLPKRIDEMVIH